MAQRSSPPGPPHDRYGLPRAAEFRRDPVAFAGRLQREFGDTVFFQLGPVPCFQFTGPAEIQEVLVREASKLRKPRRLKAALGRFQGQGLLLSDGPEWVRLRQAVQVAFDTKNLVLHIPTIQSQTQTLLAQWSSQSQVNVSESLAFLTFRITCRTLFSTDVDEVAGEFLRAVDVRHEWSIAEMHRTFSTPAWWPLIGHPNARRAVRFFRTLADRIIDARRREADPPGDLLDLLLAMQRDRALSDRWLAHELLTFLLAGHETLAVSLAWACDLLAANPDVQAQTASAVFARLGHRPPEHEDLPNLTMVEAVYREALRLFPPVYFFGREVAETATIGSYSLEPGTQIFVSPYWTHRDPRWFPDPERFEPSRFLGDAPNGRPTHAWLPFGGGPRACIGRGQALLEATVILTMILQRFRLARPASHQPPEPEQNFVLRPKRPIRLELTDRGETSCK